MDKDLVRKYLSTLDEYKSPGPDSLHLRVLRELAGIILETLNVILQSYIAQGKYQRTGKKLI